MAAAETAAAGYCQKPYKIIKITQDCKMNGIYNIDNMVAKIAKEHKIITEYVVKFNKSLKNRDKEFFNI